MSSIKVSIILNWRYFTNKLQTRLQCSPPGVFKGPIDCLRQTLLKENILALYKGGLAPAISWGCSDALLMGSLHNYRILILENKLKFFTEPMPGSSDKTRLSLAGMCFITSMFHFNVAQVKH